MTDFHLAQCNVGRLAAPFDSPALADFVAWLADINALAESSPGFVWRLVDDGGQDATSLRPYPDPDMMINMSVWAGVDELQEYVYRSRHLAVLRRRREWFRRLDGPHQVLWWIPAGHRPTVAEAVARLEDLT